MPWRSPSLLCLELSTCCLFSRQEAQNLDFISLRSNRLTFWKHHSHTHLSGRVGRIPVSRCFLLRDSYRLPPLNIWKPFIFGRILNLLCSSQPSSAEHRLISMQVCALCWCYAVGGHRQGHGGWTAFVFSDLLHCPLPDLLWLSFCPLPQQPLCLPAFGLLSCQIS